MAISFSCDGCGNPVTDPVKIGHITRREYCEECKVIAERFVEAEESLRATTHERFIDDRALLVAKFSEGGFRLPDITS